MRHVPHLYIPGPWDGPTAPLTDGQLHHLKKVFRLQNGSIVTYTDGDGSHGRGVLEGEGVARAAEHRRHRSRTLTVAAAPPASRDRQRFLVEKLAELGVASLRWLKSAQQSRPPPGAEKARAWAIGALQQSGGAFLMAVVEPTPVEAISGPVAIADPAGNWAIASWSGFLTLVVGPAGGLTEGEVEMSEVRLRLSDQVLRTETAAVVGAGLLLAQPESDV